MTQRTLNGRYELETVIGHGGMAEVWRGYDRRLGREVAVKVLRSDLATDEVFVERLRREARSVARLNHPNIVAIYDAGGDSVSGVLLPYLVMEYVPGRPLGTVLADGQRFTPERAVEVTTAILEALEFSHRAGFVHRDIKPGNVMLTADGGVKVMDFGIARAIAATSAELTKTAQVLGTARYLSPEQATGGAVDGRSDVYSTGCLLYELLVGRPPYVAENALGVIGLHVQAPVPSALDADPDVPAALAAVAARAMAKDPSERFQSAEGMRAALAAAVDDPSAPLPAAVGVPAVPAVPAGANGANGAAVARRRGPAVLYGLAAAGVVLAIAGGSYLLTDRSAPVSDPRPAKSAPGSDSARGGVPGTGTGGGSIGEVGDDGGSGENRSGPRPGSSSSVTPGTTPPPGAPDPTAPAPGPEPTPRGSTDPSTSPEPEPEPSDSDSPSPEPEPSDSPSPDPEPSDSPTPSESATPEPTQPASSTSPDPTGSHRPVGQIPA